MNYSRAGGPTPVNKPGIDKRIDDKMEILLEQQKALEEGIDYYSLKMKANDFWFEWYSNARQHYYIKLDKVIQEIKNTSGYKDKEPKDESEPGVEAAQIGEAIGSSKTPNQKKTVRAKDGKAS